MKTKLNIALISFFAFSVLTFLTRPSFAIEEYSRPAVDGYDVVAYYTKNKAVRGDGLKTSHYEGKTYLFSNDKNKEAFEKDPTRYMPQFGGWCAYGVSVNKKFHGDPTVFAVVDDKLYFNVNQAIYLKWSVDKKGNIAKADANWPEIQDKDPASL